MQTKYKWKFVTQLHSGHRIFLDENTSKLAIADNSGPMPDTTDDGLLWLKKVLVSMYDNVPVVGILTNDINNYTWNVEVMFSDIPKLIELGFEFTFDPRIAEHMETWRQVIALFDVQEVSAA